MPRQINSREVMKVVGKHPDDFSIIKQKGSHFGVRHKSGARMTCVYGEMSPGVSHKVIKWFKRFGIILLVILMCRLMPFILAFFQVMDSL